ncbi:MAG TPA: hypothetical protein ENI89_04195 [Desulfobulbus sp.]|nr:hypothetical protein [Desulfobulbus sp.]
MIQTDIRPMPEISGWEEFLEQGEGYLKTATRGYAGRRKIFTPEILYNLIAMAIEKFVMAALMRQGSLPCNHTMADLVEAMEALFPDLIAEFREDLLALDRYQEICALDTFHIRPPSMDEIPAMLDLARHLRNILENAEAQGAPPGGTATV